MNEAPVRREEHSGQVRHDHRSSETVLARDELCLLADRGTGQHTTDPPQSGRDLFVGRRLVQRVARGAGRHGGRHGARRLVQRQEVLVGLRAPERGEPVGVVEGGGEERHDESVGKVGLAHFETPVWLASVAGLQQVYMH